MRNKIKFFSLVIAVGCIMLLLGSVMGAQRYVDIHTGGSYIRVTAPMNLSRHTRVNNVTVTESGTAYINEKDTEAFSRIDISVISSDIIIKQADHYGVQMEYPAERDVAWSIRNGKLTIEEQTISQISRITLFGTRSSTHWLNGGRIIIYAPANPMESMDLSTVSGNITVENFIADEIKAESVSGNITISDCTTDRFRAATVSGDIRHENANGNNDVRFSSISGRIDFSTPDRQSDFTIHINSVSGGFHINNESIGRVEYRQRGGGKNINAETVSGRIALGFGD
jgi:DUF4097 and DUF4098 domain-containing protein YvlB